MSFFRSFTAHCHVAHAASLTLEQGENRSVSKMDKIQ